jgi:hypothetical protein
MQLKNLIDLRRSILMNNLRMALLYPLVLILLFTFGFEKRTTALPRLTSQAKIDLHIPFCTTINNHGITDLEYFTYASSVSTFIDTKRCIYYSFPAGNKGKLQAYDIKETIIESLPGKLKATDKAITMWNAFKGNNPEKWTTKNPTYRTIDYGEIYNNINLKLATSHEGVEKIFTVRPGGNPCDIRISIDGAVPLKVDKGGAIIPIKGHKNFSISSPIGYQIINGRREFIDVSYVLMGNVYGFSVKNYDSSKDLVIDPIVSSTYFDTPESLKIAAIALDASGNVIVSGTNDFSNNLSDDGFVAKFDAGLTNLITITYLAGSNVDESRAIALDSIGNVYVTGRTSSCDFPTTSSAYDNTCNGKSDTFVSKFDNSLSTLIASTYVGGSDYEDVRAIAVDPWENIFISGGTDSTDYPLSQAFDSTYSPGAAFWDQHSDELFVTRLDNGLMNLLASSYLGGSHGEEIVSMVIDPTGNIYMAGNTNSSDFPISAGAYDTNSFTFSTVKGFISKIDLGSGLLLGTFLDVNVKSIAYGNGSVCIAGSVPESNSPFPITAGNLYSGGGHTLSSVSDAIVIKLNDTLTNLIASFEIGGTSDDFGESIRVGTSGNIYLIGKTLSLDYPILTGSFGGNGDVLISVFDTNLTRLLSSTYLGGNGTDYPTSFALDQDDNIYIAGYTESSNFPLSNGAYSMTSSAASDAFISVISPDAGIGSPVPNIRVAQDDSTSVLTIYNLGAKNLTISDIYLSKIESGGFNLKVNGGSKPCGSTSPTISSGGYCTIDVPFDAACTSNNSVKYNNDVVIKSNDPDSPNIEISLVGFTSVCSAVSDIGEGGGGGGIFGAISINDVIGYHLDGITRNGTRIYMPITNGFKALRGAQTHIEKFAPSIAKIIRSGFESLECKAEADKEGWLYRIGTYAYPILGKIAEFYLDVAGSRDLMTNAYIDTTIDITEFNKLHQQGIAISPHVVKDPGK